MEEVRAKLCNPVRNLVFIVLQPGRIDDGQGGSVRNVVEEG